MPAGPARQARALGATRFAAIMPYYLPASMPSVRAYFEEICRQVEGLPVYAYHSPATRPPNSLPSTSPTSSSASGSRGAKFSIPGTRFLSEVAGRVPAGPTTTA